MDVTLPITDGPRPKHEQCREALARHIRDHLAPGSPIPSERSLQQNFGVSRATVRRAVEQLITDGLLTRVPAKGTYVAQPRLDSRLHLASFSQDMRRRGHVPSTVLLEVARRDATGTVAEALKLRPDQEVWQIRRIRLADDEPVAVEEGWYPVSLLPDLDREDLGGSLYRVLAERYGYVIDAAEQTVWGEISDARTSAHLGAETPVPLLVFRRISHAAGVPVEHVVSRYRGDRYEVHMSLHAGEVPADHGPPSERN